MMNADGSGKVAVPYGEPTYSTHNGFHWHLQLLPIAGEFFANGDPREEIFAVREDGGASVQLTSDPAVQPIQFIGDRQGFRWSVDAGVADGKISFTGVRLDVGGDIIESGIYAAQVAFDASDPMALTEELVWLVPLQPDPLSPGQFLDVPETENHDWSPDGSLLVYDDYTTVGDLWIADPENNSSSLLVTGGVNPDWSPDGTAIVYHGFGDVMTIAPDGSNWTLVVEGSQKGPATSRRAKNAYWSPDSAFIAYRWHVFNNGGDTMDVYIVGRDGSGNSNLTNDLSDLAAPTAWR